MAKEGPRLPDGFILEGRYRIVRRIGSGGMGTVYLAEDMKLAGKKWAVKEANVPAIQLKNWEAEAKMLTQLNHPLLPRIVDVLHWQGRSYLVMDYIEGKTLQALFEEKKGDLPVAFVVGLAAELCDLLHFLHRSLPQPIIHRDLKPTNIMIDHRNHVRLIDFGAARSYKGDKQADTLQLGTLAFASPEQLSGRQTDPRSDLFSLGALMYFLLSRGQSFYAVRRPLRQVRPELPEKLCRLVDKLLKENPEDRYASAWDVKRELLALDGPFQPSGSVPGKGGYSSSAEGNGFPPEPRRIVIGSLYPGAGSTFVTLALARSLNAIAVPHAVVEFPTNLPEMYHLLHGEKNAPNPYRFLADDVIADGSPLHRIPWKDGFCEWIPLNPEGSYAGWTEEHSFKLFFLIKKPIVLVDVSHRLNEPPVRQICRDSDEMYLVVDSLPGKLSRRLLQPVLDGLAEMAERGKTIRIIVNRQTASTKSREWYRELPFPAACACPNFPYEDVLEGIWKGKLVFDGQNAKEKLLPGFAGLIQRWIPDGKRRIKEALGPGNRFAWFRGKTFWVKNKPNIDL